MINNLSNAFCRWVHLVQGLDVTREVALPCRPPWHIPLQQGTANLLMFPSWHPKRRESGRIGWIQWSSPSFGQNCDKNTDCACNGFLLHRAPHSLFWFVAPLWASYTFLYLHKCIFLALNVLLYSGEKEVFGSMCARLHFLCLCRVGVCVWRGGWVGRELYASMHVSARLSDPGS